MRQLEKLWAGGEAVASSSCGGRDDIGTTGGDYLGMGGRIMSESYSDMIPATPSGSRDALPDGSTSTMHRLFLDSEGGRVRCQG
jgi:hypothetical protein